MNLRSTLSTALAAVLAASSFAQVGMGGPSSRSQYIRTSTGHPWAMRHSNFQRTGQTDFIGPAEGNTVWKYRVPAFPPGIAVAKTGNVLLGPTFNPAWWSEEVYATLVSRDGDALWRKKVVPYSWGASQGISSGPGIDPQGFFILPSTNGQVLKLSPSGDLVWTFQGNASATNDNSPAVLNDGSVRHNQFGMYGLSADGQLQFQTGVTAKSAVAVSSNGEMAMGTGRSNEPHNFVSLYYMSPFGQVLWTVVTTYGGASTPVFGPDETVYSVIDGRGITNYNRNGTVRWQSNFGSIGRAPALSKTGVLYVNSGLNLRAYDAVTGAILWTTAVSHSMNDGLCIDKLGNIFASTSDGYVIKFSPSGGILWQSRIAEQLSAHPAIGSDGSLYVSGLEETYVKYVYKIR